MAGAADGSSFFLPGSNLRLRPCPLLENLVSCSAARQREQWPGIAGSGGLVSRQLFRKGAPGSGLGEQLCITQQIL